MIRFVLNRAGKSSLFIPVLVACIVVAGFSRVGSAADLDRSQAEASQGLIARQLKLAQAYFTGQGVARNATEAAYLIQKAAGSGDPEAENLAGYLYQSGLGVAADPARALHWYQLAAANGSSNANLNLGVLYVLGIGVLKDEAAAAHYFKKAVDEGNGTGADYLGTMAYNGVGATPDKAAAERWYTIGQKMHDPISAYDLGKLYSTDPDHAHDLAKAAGLLRQSANAAYVPAMDDLGSLLVRHPELSRKPEEGKRFLEAAANAGSWRSSTLLGILARDGEGMPVDGRAAYYHFQIAAQQGGKMVQSLLGYDLNQLGAALGPDQVRSVQAEADAWIQQHSGSLAFVHGSGSAPRLFADAAGSDPVEP